MDTPPASRLQLACIDFDGTLVDTRPLWEAAYLTVAKQRNWALPANWWPIIAGKSMAASATVFGVDHPDEQADVATRLVDTATSLAPQFPPVVMPGAHELFRRAAESRVALRIVTSTFTDLAKILAQAAGFPAVPVTGGDQVSVGKPAPDIYLKACEDSGCFPEAAAAVEDSPTGIKAARTAGLFVYALGEHQMPNTSRQRVIRHLDEVIFVS